VKRTEICVFIFFGIALFSAQALLADAALQPAFYATGSLGTRLLLNNDADQYFDASSLGFTASKFEPSFSLIGGGAIGFQSSSLFGLEVGGDIGPDRVLDETYRNSAGGTLLTAEETWNVYGFYIRPTLRFMSSTGFTDKPFFGVLGLKIGESFLDGTSEATNQVKGQTGTYKQSASTTTFGVSYRFGQMLSPSMDLGLEISYDYTIFSSVTASNGSGIYANASGIDENADGSRLQVDASGITVKLVLEGWFSEPVQDLP
jgi:hypothetical protein